VKLKTVFEYPPIPCRDFDWCAYDEDTMDVCQDPDCSCRRNVVRGFGATQEEAVLEFVSEAAQLSRCIGIGNHDARGYAL